MRLNIFKKKRPRSGRVTIVEDGPWDVGPLVARVMGLRWVDLRAGETGVEPEDRCVISRGPSYTTRRDYDGLTVRVSELEGGPWRAEQEPVEALKEVMRDLVEQRKKLS